MDPKGFGPSRNTVNTLKIADGTSELKRDSEQIMLFLFNFVLRDVHVSARSDPFVSVVTVLSYCSDRPNRSCESQRRYGR